MYKPEEEKLVLSLDQIRAAMDDEEGWQGYVYESHMLPWVHPRNITGLDLERLVRVNRARHYNWTFENVPGVDYQKLADPDYEDDDDLVLSYLDSAASQREALSKQHPHIEPISGVRYFAALLYMVTDWESAFHSYAVDKSRMTLDEILECVDLYEAAFHETPHCHIKHGLPDEMDIFLCNTDFQFALKELPAFQAFLDDPGNLDRLERMRARFREDCPELAARSAREAAEAAEASALLAADRRKRGDAFHMPEGNPLFWGAEERTIYSFNLAVANWFAGKWLEQLRAGKQSPFRWKFHLALWRGMPREAPVSEELLNALSDFTSDPEAMALLFRHLDEDGRKYSGDSKRVLARLRARYPA